MGLIKAISGAIRGVAADQWKEYFYCDALENHVLVKKGQRRMGGKFGSNNKGNDNLISNGSVIAVNEGQCMIIVDQGKVAEFCAEAGEFLYDTSTEPSLLYGDLGQNIGKTFSTIGKRFTFGGDTGKDQRVYFFNTKEIIGNKYGTANPIPFRVVDNNIGLDVDISVRCNGEYSYQIFDPILFYTNVCGNVTEEYTRDKIDSQLKAELMTALQPAFAQISAMGIRYSAVPGHTMEVAAALNQVLSQKWEELRGIRVVSFGVNTIKASEEDENMIKELQRTAVLRNPNMAAATLAGAQAEALKSAAANTSTGPMMAFAGMNMANQAGGMDANTLFSMGQQMNDQNMGTVGSQQNNPQDMSGNTDSQQNNPQGMSGMNTQQSNAQSTGTQPQGAGRRSPGAEWVCKCGTVNTGKFCRECGTPRGQDKLGWTCSCGTVNTGKFCTECGAKKPPEAPLYRCDKCGWEPEDPYHPPKFCPECGDIFDENDIQ